MSSRGFFHRAKPVITSVEKEGVFCFPARLWGSLVYGSLTGTPIDSEDTLAFSVLENIRPMIETVSLEQAANAYARMMQGKARFRMVLVSQEWSSLECAECGATRPSAQQSSYTHLLFLCASKPKENGSTESQAKTPRSYALHLVDCDRSSTEA